MKYAEKYYNRGFLSSVLAFLLLLLLVSLIEPSVLYFIF